MGIFRGSVLHCQDFSSAQAVEGKRVVIVGGGKAAIDASYKIASQGNATSITVVYRQVGQAKAGRAGGGHIEREILQPLSNPGGVLGRSQTKTYQKNKKRITKTSLSAPIIKQSALSTQFDADHSNFPQ